LPLGINGDIIVPMIGLLRTYRKIDAVIASIEPDKFGCLIWPKKLKGGYPLIRDKRVHCMLLAREIGRPLVGYALHGCDNPSCVNIAHLYEGTAKDNMLDKAARNYDWRYSLKGRVPKCRL
jgi:hypothetical protein